MSGPVRHIVREDATLRVDVALNSRLRSVVRITTVSPEALLDLTTFDVCSGDARDRAVGRVPEAHRPAVADLLRQASVGVADLRETLPADEAPIDEDDGGGLFAPVKACDDDVDLGELLSDIAKLITDHVVVSAAVVPLIAIWILHTYCLAASDFSPYLWIRSATRACGKSTLVDLLAKLARRSIAAVNVSTSALFRLIERFQCTVFLDDIDSWMRGDRREDIASILNSGFKRGTRVIRVEPNAAGQFEPKFFDVFSPKVLSGIGRQALVDTTASRTLPIEVRKALPEDLKKIQRPRDAEMEALCAPVRSRLVRWSTDHLEELKARRPAIPDALTGRSADLAAPFLAVAESAGGDWPIKTRSALVDLLGQRQQGGEEKVELLWDIRAMFAEQSAATWLRSKAMVEWLRGQPGRPWEDWKGRGLTTKGLADILDDFDIKPTKGGERKCERGYPKTAFEPAWRAYPPSESAASADSLQDNDLRQNQSAAGAADQKPANSLWHNESADAADQNPLPGEEYASEGDTALDRHLEDEHRRAVQTASGVRP